MQSGYSFLKELLIIFGNKKFCTGQQDSHVFMF